MHWALLIGWDTLQRALYGIGRAECVPIYETRSFCFAIQPLICNSPRKEWQNASVIVMLMV